MTVSFVVWCEISLVLLAGLAFYLVFRRMLARTKDQAPTLDWAREFSAARYRAMERLFSREDYEFLSAQQGYHPRIVRDLEASRRRIFRKYLRNLSSDFERLYFMAKLLLVNADHDRPDLTLALLRQRLTFRYAMAMMRCRLVLQPLGVGVSDVRGLVNAVDAMWNQFRQLHQPLAAQPSSV